MPTRIEEPTFENKAIAANTAQRAPRRVSFLQTEVSSFSDEDSPMTTPLTTQERDELWYNTNDLIEFKNQARELSRHLRRNSVVDGKDSTRGLEHRVCMNRQKSKYLAIRAILKAQAFCESPQELADVSRKCTAWAKEVALLTGHSDYYHAYNPSLAHLVNTTPRMPTLWEEGVRQQQEKKRRLQLIEIDSSSSSSDEETTSRRVRPRFLPSAL